jgi:hypothetical protein
MTGTEQGQSGDLTHPRRIFPRGLLTWLEHCWNKGANAREIGFERVSPYYEDIDADLYWFAGFDGMSFEAAIEIHHSQPEATHHEQSN